MKTIGRIFALLIFLALCWSQTVQAYYDPMARRFISFDPLGHGASMDGYSYANGDPVNFVDPDGRLGKAANDVVGMAAYSVNGNPEDFVPSSQIMTSAFQQDPAVLQQKIILGTMAAEALVASPLMFRAAVQSGPALYVGATALAYNPWTPVVVGGVTAGAYTHSQGGSPKDVAISAAIGSATMYTASPFPVRGQNAPANINSAKPTVDRIANVAQQGYNYAVENPRVQNLTRTQLGIDAEVQTTRWLRRWAERNTVSLGPEGLQFQVRGAHSAPDVVFHPDRQIFDFKLTPRAVRPSQTENFRNDFPGYDIEYLFSP